ncbi:heparan-alpha-glucosaminide N-acetyltransferase domain-containing protein [Nocardioides psychrotolerans]|uniref:heparan-alpha-glucosaminide N-acetyltransferase domain-containing protein n=1 Tax=Nocardioides psychrotolerans TaxID=1005945 RepID=UPI002109B319|nr:heparan-alpha-glucosaminide N-acetyltransferase domain-containing protein [Nocardioides psychrotolerans]
MDVARCLALLGMVATHVVATTGPDGGLSFAHWLAGGRASALFTVLAGVSLALMTGRRVPVRGRERGARSAGLAVRALIVASFGLLLGELDSGLAVILTYYGLLFLLGLVFVGLRAPTLLALAVVWAVLAPVASQVVRPLLPERGFASPAVGQLADPVQLLSELTFTGYYPVVPWLAYLLLGLGIGRLDLGRRSVQLGLVGFGLGVAVAATVGSRLLLERPGVAQRLSEELGPRGAGAAGLRRQIEGGMFGNTPSGGSWDWLLVVAPHSTTPFDLAQTMGSALVVVGSCLLVVAALPPFAERVVAIVFGAGTMTLTLYSLHVLLRTDLLWPPDEGAYAQHALVLLAIGAVLVALERRGPLERLVGAASARASALVRRP